jgi:hypothetical protein
MKTLFYNYKGKQVTVKELAEISGHGVGTIHYRLKSGWEIEDIVKKPKRDCGGHRLCEVKGCWNYTPHNTKYCIIHQRSPITSSN